MYEQGAYNQKVNPNQCWLLPFTVCGCGSREVGGLTAKLRKATTRRMKWRKGVGVENA
jgi:hypothetical protein